MEVIQRKFGRIDQQTVHLFIVRNDNGAEIACIDYGCIITKIIVPDIYGKFENIVLGFDTLGEYLRYSPYFGAVVGRAAGRIKNGEFDLNGKKYSLTQNEGYNHIHGGVRGLSHVLWDTTIIEKENEAGVEFTYISPDGEEGYPGTLNMKVTYRLTNKNELVISYDGIADETTLLNITNHSYFNLSGNLKRDILDHIVTLGSDDFIELDHELLPTGQITNVEDSPFDFRKGRKLSDGVYSSYSQNVLAGNGYDHPFLLKNQQREIELKDELSGRKLIVETDQPSIVLYTGNQLTNDFQIRGKDSGKYMGVCLETQAPPDAIHHPHFPSVVLEEKKPYHSETKYSFTTSQFYNYRF